MTKEFWEDFDPNFKDFHADLDKHIKKMGVKSVFFAILKHWREKHNDRGYNFKQVKL